MAGVIQHLESKNFLLMSAQIAGNVITSEQLNECRRSAGNGSHMFHVLAYQLFVCLLVLYL